MLQPNICFEFLDCTLIYSERVISMIMQYAFTVLHFSFAYVDSAYLFAAYFACGLAQCTVVESAFLNWQCLVFEKIYHQNLAQMYKENECTQAYTSLM